VVVEGRWMDVKYVEIHLSTIDIISLMRAVLVPLLTAMRLLHKLSTIDINTSSPPPIELPLNTHRAVCCSER